MHLLIIVTSKVRRQRGQLSLSSGGCDICFDAHRRIDTVKFHISSTCRARKGMVLHPCWGFPAAGCVPASYTTVYCAPWLITLCRALSFCPAPYFPTPPLTSLHSPAPILPHSLYISTPSLPGAPRKPRIRRDCMGVRFCVLEHLHAGIPCRMSRSTLHFTAVSGGSACGCACFLLNHEKATDDRDSLCQANSALECNTVEFDC